MANQGVRRLSMSEVGRLAGVGSGTVYRHFPTRDALLGALATREARRFVDRLNDSLKPSPGQSPIDILVHHSTWTVREYTILCELLEAEPGFVLQAIREGFGTLRESVGKLMAPWLADQAEARSASLTDDQLFDLLTRLLLSHFLVPEGEPERVAREVAELIRSVTLEPGRA